MVSASKFVTSHCDIMTVTDHDSLRHHWYPHSVPRWDPEAAPRLQTAAIELFLELGYENVTVAQIAERAGLTRRTFSRYFADKRDVLFAGSDQLPPALATAVLAADAALSPYAALVTALVDVGAELANRVVPLAAQRRAVVAGSPELQERGRTKFAEVAIALAGALGKRGLDAADARLLANVGVAIFQCGFDRWVDDPDSAGLPIHIREAADHLAGALAANTVAS
jgi:AcrR family transcriptional regulator